MKKATTKKSKSTKSSPKKSTSTKSMRVGGGGRFAKLKAKLEEKGDSNPGALAAYIGRKKYGNKKFAEMAQKGRKRAAKKK
jgi:hypothetical protein